MEPPGGVEPPVDRIRNPVPFRLATGVSHGELPGLRTIANARRRARRSTRRRLRIARLAVNARPVGNTGGNGRSRTAFFRASTGRCAVSAAFPWRSGRESNALVAFATHRRSRSTPYRSATTPRMRSRRGPSRTGDATLPRSRERVRRPRSSGECQHAAQEPHANLRDDVCSFQRTHQTGRARPCTH